jgi:hypothetical protein
VGFAAGGPRNGRHVGKSREGRVWAQVIGLGAHGRMGKNEDMKSHKTNLEAVEPTGDHSDEESMAKRTHRPEIRLGREAQARIGELLRNMYNSYLNEGVPSHLADLVRRLGDES